MATPQTSPRAARMPAPDEGTAQPPNPIATIPIARRPAAGHRQRAVRARRDQRLRAGPACLLRHAPEIHAVDVDRAGDVLDLLRAEILEREAQLVEDLIAHDAADADSAGLGQRFEARRDIDAIAEDVVAVDDDVADIDADPKIETLVGGNALRCARPCRAAHRRRSAPRRRRSETPAAGRRRSS